ncbi:MAG: AAA family ATPase, partial [Prevotella sp.]|nr:AAA family ATPase [Prevotella sp.]
MLKRLFIKNFTLIDELDIQFNSGFSVITGETGAGKSIILGAIGLLLGQRADLKAIKTDTKKCTIEAHFNLSHYNLESFFKENDIDYDTDDCILRREITISGKSRAFINDTPVQLSLMRSLGEQLIDIHSQHQNLLLQKEDFQLTVVDLIAQDTKELVDYQTTYEAYKEKVQAFEILKANIEQNKKDEDFIRFQYNELVNAKLEDGEQETLELESKKLSHSEEIKSALFEADHLMNNDESGAILEIKSVIQNLHSIEKVYPTIKETIKRLDSSYIELKDIAQDINSDVENIDFDPARLDEINARLDTIYTLERKFRVETISELQTIEINLKNKLEKINNSDSILSDLQIEIYELENVCSKKANALTKLRRQAIKIIETEMQNRLIPLGIPHVQFKVDISSLDTFGITGQDKIQFLFSANKNIPMRPVAQIASGGEIARVMLSLKAM